ncbi:MAG: prepilin peptidase [Acidimicrobiales bacterium]
MTYLGLALGGIIGAVLGSTSSAMAYRLPLSLPLFNDRSRCPKCDRQLRWYENVPVVSFVLQSGRCRGCGESIGLRYLIAEMLLASYMIMLVVRHGLGWSVAVDGYVGFIALIATQTDLAVRRIPNRLTAAGGIGVGVLLALEAIVTDRFAIVVGGLIAALIVGGALYLVAVVSRGGFGLGDVKLAMVLSAPLATYGATAVVNFLVMSFFAGSVVGIMLMVRHRATRKTALAFGPFLALGYAVITLILR